MRKKGLNGLPEGVSPYVDRHGRTRYRYRVRGMKPVELGAVLFSSDFMKRLLQAKERDHSEVGSSRTRPGSVSAAMAAYYASAEWKQLSPSTQRMRRNILEGFRSNRGPNNGAAYGDRPLKELTRVALLRIRDRYADRPHAGNNLIKALRQLFTFAIDREMMRENVAARIKPLPSDSDGHHTWTDAEIDQFKAKWPCGTKQRLALELLNCTSQRRGDVTRMGRQHDRGLSLVVRQGKTGIELTLPITPDLRRELDQAPKTQMTFLETELGRPYSPAYFGNKFAEWCDAAGLPKNCRAHGIRKSVATRLADAGHTTHEIAAVTGHARLSEVARYTKAADRKKNAERTRLTLSGTKTERPSGEPESRFGEPPLSEAETRQKRS